MFFAIGRAAYDGYRIDEQPALTKSGRNVLVYTYMIGKCSSRCAFYQTAAALCRKGKWGEVREVVNPSRGEKVRGLAERGGVCPHKFQSVCR